MIQNQEPRAKFQPWEGNSTPPTGSLPAQIAHKLVSDLWPQMAMPMHHRLLEAYFSENRTISDWTVLADLVSEIGEDSSLFLFSGNKLIGFSIEPSLSFLIDLSELKAPETSPCLLII